MAQPTLSLQQAHIVYAAIGLRIDRGAYIYLCSRRPLPYTHAVLRPETNRW